MTLREKMKVCGVSVKEVSNHVPEASYPAVNNILKENLSARVLHMSEKLCQERAQSLRKTLEQI